MDAIDQRGASPSEARGLVEAAAGLTVPPESCDIEHWLSAVAQGTLRGLVHGHAPGAAVPEALLSPGPLREAVVQEFAFRTISEEMGTRAISHLIRTAPSAATMDFYTTQLLDEARHAAVFRRHLVDLGTPEPEIPALIEAIAGARREAILEPLERFALVEAGGRDEFIVGVVMLTVIVEGVLAPASELSERKWRLLDPPGAQAARGANLDEVRHLCVGGAVVERHLREHPEDRDRLAGLVRRGLELWQDLPIRGLIVEREALFQEGMAEHRGLLGDYEIVPGRRLLDTGVEERLAIQMGWSRELQHRRLAAMGLLP